MAGPPYSLEGDTSGLPKTARSGIPYEIEALTVTETWGASNGNMTLRCRQLWEDSTDWIRDLVGTVSVTRSGSGGGSAFSLLRNIPEKVQYNDGRLLFATMTNQIDQGGNPVPGGVLATASGSNWPATEWYRAQVVFEAMPYAILTSAQMNTISGACGAYAGAQELYRYVIRTKRTYSKEQPVPGAGPAGGFKVATSPTVPGDPIGQVGFRVVSMADISYKWVRVPVGWPPPLGWTPTLSTDWPWPPAVNPVGTQLDIIGGSGPTPAPSAIPQRSRDVYVGTVNNNWFDCAAPDGYAFPPGTLLYTGYDDSNKYFDAAGDWVCDVVFSFKFVGGKDAGGNYGGWNYFLNALGQWVPVTDNGLTTGNPPYKSSPFDNLFQYA